LVDPVDAAAGLLDRGDVRVFRTQALDDLDADLDAAAARDRIEDDRTDGALG